MTTTTSGTRTHSLQERPSSDLEIYEPFRISAGLAIAVAALLVVIVAFAVDPTHAALALGAVVAIWLTGLIR